MKPSELRIGNWVYPNEENATPYPVLEIYENSILCFKSDRKLIHQMDVVISCEELEGIPITEEWLLKVGFEKDYIAGGIFFYIFKKIIIGFDSESKTLFYANEDNLIDNCPDILFVHQLQNLFFAIKGEELILNNEIPNASSKDNP